jgi:outer membrane murein-binding lipoprotein Lpp
VENKKDEEFKLLIEHTNVLGCNGTLTHEFDGVKIEESEKITNGIRLYFVLPAGESLTLTVTETMVAEQSFGLGNQFNWLQQNVINVKHPLALDKGILAAAEIQKQIDAVGVQIRDTTARKNELVQQAERVRSNLQATKDEAASQIRTQWVTDLDESEKEIRLIDKKLIPDLQAKQRDLQEQLGEYSSLEAV